MQYTLTAVVTLMSFHVRPHTEQTLARVKLCEELDRASLGEACKKVRDVSRLAAITLSWYSSYVFSFLVYTHILDAHDLAAVTVSWCSSMCLVSWYMHIVSWGGRGAYGIYQADVSLLAVLG